MVYIICIFSKPQYQNDRRICFFLYEMFQFLISNNFHPRKYPAFNLWRAFIFKLGIQTSSIKKISFPPYWIVPPLEYRFPIISPLEFL